MGPWINWGTSVANVTNFGPEGILGRGAQAVKPLPITYGVKYTFEVKFDRMTLVRPSMENVVAGVASYGGIFVPRQRIVPSAAPPPNPFINLAPLQHELAMESLALKLLKPETDGLTVEVTNVFNSERMVLSTDIREADVFAPGIWTRVELRAVLALGDKLYGQVRFALLDTDDAADYGEVNTFEFDLLARTTTPWVWAWLGPSHLPEGGWQAYRSFVVNDRPDE